uniref:Uncharacterized protein n=1 Tax=Tanacetum cinerariifolium TaxID=118510 RepID=A0A6L2L395_TANCI|nr:hypothetical protein [Tanacetum cinerariifolium]
MSGIHYLGNYVKKCLSDGLIRYKMGHPLPHKLDAKEHPHTITQKCCKKGFKLQSDLKDFHEEIREMHYSLNNNFKLLCSVVEPLAKAKKLPVFDGAFRGVGDKEVVVGEGVSVTYSSLEMLTNSCLGGIMVSLVFLEGLEEEA